jgi:DNA-binding response OmpR family regulator
MEPAVSSLSNAMTPPSALIAEPVLPDALFLVRVASSLGFHVTVTHTFQTAADRLRLMPELLMADIRLGEYNGLHLVLRGKSARAGLTAVVTSAVDDIVLRSEAEQLGATFVVKPATVEEMRAAICRTWLRRADSSDEPIRAPFERRSVERRQVTTLIAEDRRVADRRRDFSQVFLQRATPLI